MGKRKHGSDGSDGSEEDAARKTGFGNMSAPPGGNIPAGFSGVLGAGGGGGAAATPASMNPSLAMGGSISGGPIVGGAGGAGAGLLMGNGVPDLEQAPQIATTPMDFSNLGKAVPTQLIPVPKKLVEHLMTPATKRILEDQSGVEIDWAPDYEKGPQVMMRGSPEQVRLAGKLISRVKTQCHWGCSEAKIHRLLKGGVIQTALCRLSPMDSLSNVEKLLSAANPRLTIGKGKENDAVVLEQAVSRQHCYLELSADKGAIYIADMSTNGTFLNGVRLPSRKLGKVLLSHGDELLLKEPSSTSAEFGYIVNITEIHVRREVKLEAPRRLLAPDEGVDRP